MMNYAYGLFFFGVLTLLVWGCGKPQQSAAASVSVSGKLSNAGAVSGATVNAYPVTSSSGAKVTRWTQRSQNPIKAKNSTSPIATTTTASDGSFTLAIPEAYNQSPIQITATGGTVNGSANNTTLEAALSSPFQDPSVQVNNLTTLAAQVFLASPSLSSATSNSAIQGLVDQANGQVANLFGLKQGILTASSSSNTLADDALANLNNSASLPTATLASDLVAGALSSTVTNQLTTAETTVQSSNPTLAHVPRSRG